MQSFRKPPTKTQKREVEVLATQSCLTLCDPMDCSPPGPSAHGISRARILEWAAISSSRRIFPPQVLSPCLLHLQHWQVDSLPLESPVCVLVTQLCLTLCDPMDCSPPGSSVHGILQARILEWVAIPFSGIFLTQGLNLSFLHYRQILYHLSHRGSLKDQK